MSLVPWRWIGWCTIVWNVCAISLTFEFIYGIEIIHMSHLHSMGLHGSVPWRADTHIKDQYMGKVSFALCFQADCSLLWRWSDHWGILVSCFPKFVYCLRALSVLPTPGTFPWKTVEVCNSLGEATAHSVRAGAGSVSHVLCLPNMCP